MEAQHTKYVTYKLAYYFVWCPTYRKKILVGTLATFVEREIRVKRYRIGAILIAKEGLALLILFLRFSRIPLIEELLIVFPFHAIRFS